MEVRTIRNEDHSDWLRMRHQLWPDIDKVELMAELDGIVRNTRTSVLVAASDEGQLIGFVEVSLRDWAEGCNTHPVGYIEAWYVEPAHRCKGVGRALIEAAERWAVSRGCTEMASDADIDNVISQESHAKVGYREIGRAVLFAKRIKETD